MIAAPGIALLLLLGVLCPSALAQKQRKQLSKDEVISLLESGVPPDRVEGEARRFGIAFPMTSATERQLRDAGATDALVRTLRELSGTRPVTGPPSPAPEVQPTRGGTSPLLVVETYPGGSQVYIDDEPVGTTSPQGMLKLSRLSAGAHRVRLSHQGYQDHVEDIDLTAGETKHMAISLDQVTSGPTPAVKPPTPAPTPRQPSGQVQDQIVAVFTVQHDHGAAGSDYCTGQMAVGRLAVHYQSATNPAHSFTLPLGEIKEAKRNAVYLSAIGAFHIKTKGGQNMNFCVVSNIGMAQSPGNLLSAINQAMGK